MPNRSCKRLPRWLGLALGCLVAWGGLVVTAPPALAHPLGNFTVNTHLGLRVEPAAVALDVVVDIAEIPALRAFPGLDAASADEVPESEQRAYRDRMCPALRGAVGLQLAGEPLELEVVDSALSFPAGSAGLATARLQCVLRSARPLEVVGRELVLTDRMLVQPVGWREITAVGDGVELVASDVPERSPSDVLREYPAHLLDTPSDQRAARLTVRAGTGVVTGATAGTEGAEPGTPRGLDPLTTAYMDLVSVSQLGVGVGLVAVALAVLLGALHAFAPGHGKTLMAAYLVGRSGSLRQAATIGVSVTVTHTAGVLVLGVLLSVAAVTAPERVYPWLSLAGGLLLVVIGARLLRDAWHGRGSPGHAHAHAHGHGHGRGGEHGHGHGVGEEPGDADRGGTPPAAAAGSPVAVAVARVQRPRHDSAVRTLPGTHRSRGEHRDLLVVGFVGGLVPSPSALMVLLGGIALGRAWFGVLLVLAYGIGMALALVGTGLLLVRARGRIELWSSARSLAGRRTAGALAVGRALPLVTSGIIVVIGVGLAAQALPRG